MKQDVILQIDYAVFCSDHGIRTEKCPTCGQDRQVYRSTTPLGLTSGDDHFFVEELVWQITGLTNTNDVIGRKVKLTIEDNFENPNVGIRGVKEIVGFQVLTD